MTGDRTPLRERLAKALRGKHESTDTRPSYRAADAVLPVIEAETAALRERAEQAERDADRLDSLLIAERAITRREQLRADHAVALLREFADTTPCDPHPGNGYCQTHGEKPPCPHAAAKKLLAALEPPKETP